MLTIYKPAQPGPGREWHEQLLDNEVRLQLEAFRQQAETPARLLLDHHQELYVAAYLRHDAAGNAVLAFSTARGLPRLREHFQLLLLPEQLTNHRAWPVPLTYRELIAQSLDRTEVACVWHGTDPDAAGYVVAGFRGMSVEFSTRLVSRCVLALGPQVPPIEYLHNLIHVVRNTPPESHAGMLLDLPAEAGDAMAADWDWQPQPLPLHDAAEFLLGQSRLTSESVVLVQGPPGTGKTFLLAEICARLLQQGQRVLVTALTNRALLELAMKPQLVPWLEKGQVLKMSLSTDEQAAAPGLRPASKLASPAATLVLATFHMSSFAASAVAVPLEEATEPQFDFVLVDEASQALLATFALARTLGRHHLWVGDPAQLPTVSRQRPESVRLPGVLQGLSTITRHASLPAYCLTHTRRLPARAASYTGLFYRNGLISAADSSVRLLPGGLSPLLRRIMHPGGGPTLLGIPLPVNQDAPAAALQLVRRLVADLFQTDEPLRVAVLSHRRATTRALQRELASQVVPAGSLLLTDTIARVQGLTCDICIFVIPAIGYAFSLDSATFNVATSRARRHTFLIAAPDISTAGNPHGPVAQFLQRLQNDAPGLNDFLE